MEIEFRGIRKDNGEMVFGDLYHGLNGLIYINTVVELTENSKCNEQIQVIPETVGQYTGLKDKNGVKIFEGDIVEFRANYTNKPCGYMNGIVIKGQYNLILKVGDIEYIASEETDDFPNGKCEVIGNIYQHKELLK